MLKRNTKSILNMARNMLKTKKIPKEFWDETIYYVVYLLNKCSMIGLNDMTPQETKNGRKPSATHLKVYEGIDYMRVDDQVRNKLDDKRKKMIFMSYDQKFKGYNLYNPNKRKMVISKDAEFNERA
jgi:hypothetical protein